MNAPLRRRALPLGCAGGGSVSKDAISSTSAPSAALSKDARRRVRRGGPRGRSQPKRHPVLPRVHHLDSVWPRNRVRAPRAQAVVGFVAAAEHVAHRPPKQQLVRNQELHRPARAAASRVVELVGAVVNHQARLGDFGGGALDARELLEGAVHDGGPAVVEVARVKRLELGCAIRMGRSNDEQPKPRAVDDRRRLVRDDVTRRNQPRRPGSGERREP